MRVGLFIDTWYPMVDGVIKVVDNYASRLAKKCEVTVFCPADKNANPIDLLPWERKNLDDRSYNYKVVHCASLPILNLDYSAPTSTLDPEFSRQLITSGLDLVHIHSPFSVAAAGARHAKLFRLPLVATLHSQYRQDFEKPLRDFKPAVDLAMGAIMPVFNLCDECWAVNGEIKKLYQEEYGLKAPCKVRLNGTDHKPVADPQAAAAKVNEMYGLAPEDNVLLFVGRINFIKNLDFTVRALKLAKEQGLKFKMLFVGQGQDEHRLAELVQALGLQDDVRLCGIVRDRATLESIYSRAKLFLFPSMYDANSLVQIEAACQGTPTIFLKGARTAGTVTADVNGFISPQGEENFAAAISRALTDSELYERVSTGARRDLYIDWDTVVDGVYEDYCRLVAWKKSLK